MIRFRCSPDADQYLIDEYIPQWLVTHSAWEKADNQPPELLFDSPEEEFQYYRANWRFSWSAPKSVLLSNLETYTGTYAPWYSIGYHVCDHDEAEPDGCVWDDVLESGPIPSELPPL